MATYKAHLPEGGFVRFEAPDNATDEQLQAVGQARVAQHHANLQKEIAKGKAEFDPTADMSGTDKVLANLGAGFSNLGQGVQSLATKVLGTDADKQAMDADVLEKRARDEQLANATTGGGALQLAGEVAPTLLIPAGGFASAGARAAGVALPRALGAQVAGKLAGSTVADAALAGGVSGALAPTTSDESTLGRAVGGALLGGAVPYLGGAVKSLIGRFNPAGGESAAARMVGERLGAGGGAAERSAAARKVADELRAYEATMPKAAESAGADLGGDILEGVEGGARRPGITLSTAAILDNPQLAALEVGSRARNMANWAEHDTAYAQSLADALRGATAEGSEIGERIGRKNANWKASMEEAMADADPEVFANHVQSLQSHVEDWLAHDPERFDAPVRKVYEQLQSDLAKAGESFNPADMQVIRRAFRGKTKFNNPSAYASAPRESSAIQDVIGRLDNALEETTGGKWSKVREGYTRDVERVDQAKAAQQLHENFYTPEGQVRGTASGIAGDLPTLSEAGFSRAAQRGEAKYSPEAARQVDAITNALRKQNITQRVKKSGTAGGGSATAPTQFAAQDAGMFGQVLADSIRKVPFGKTGMGALEGLGNVANYQRDRSLARALQDPSAMLRLLERVEASGRPLTTTQQALLRALRAGSETAGLAAQPR